MNKLSAADRCVKCGLCLPHCPTFALTGNEADSPRGRISLMQAIAQPAPPYSDGLFIHLDRCLQCGACEAMCPSKVPFGRLMDATRATIEPRRRRSLARHVVRHLGLQLVASRAATTALAGVLVIQQKLGLRWLLSTTPGLPSALKRLYRLLPILRTGALPAPKPAVQQQGSVNLFLGCASRVFDQPTLAAARRLLQSLGYRVNIPRQQGCCGALHQHNGDPDTAKRLAANNRRAFSIDNEPILVAASGCAAHLKQYDVLLEDQALHDLAERVDDILHFLCRHQGPQLKLKPFNKTVAVHIPCTHRNVLRQERHILEVLGWIPGIAPIVINPHGGCCGSAGSYMLSQPELSDRLLRPLIDALVQSGAKVLLTTNIGCAIHLQAGLKQRGLGIDVLHPVALLDKLLTSPT